MPLQNLIVDRVAVICAIHCHRTNGALGLSSSAPPLKHLLARAERLELRWRILPASLTGIVQKSRL
jgi:hypothetical protein